MIYPFLFSVCDATLHDFILGIHVVTKLGSKLGQNLERTEEMSNTVCSKVLSNFFSILSIYEWTKLHGHTVYAYVFLKKLCQNQNQFNYRRIALNIFKYNKLRIRIKVSPKNRIRIYLELFFRCHVQCPPQLNLLKY